MKHKTLTITYYISNIIKEMLFSNEEDAEFFDNVLTEYLNNPDAIAEFKAPKYASIQAVKYAINNDTFVHQLQGVHSELLIEACENMVDGSNGFNSNDCYKLPLMYIFNKVYKNNH